jgi:repressor LexA
VAGKRRADDGPDPALSERQQQILDFIEAYAERHRVSPSYREIGDAVGLKSGSTVKYQVERLQEKRCLDRRDRKPRTIMAKPPRLRSIEPGPDEVSADLGTQETVSMPFFESMAAGGLAYANPEAIDTIRLPRVVVGSGNLFAVKVTGDSMVGADIFDGDCVVVRQQNDAVNGDIVAARFGDRATVKTFRRIEGHVWLMPENPSYEPMRGDGCEIMGKVVATLHRHRSG